MVIQRGSVYRVINNMSSLSLSAVLQIVDEASKPLKLIKQFSDGGADSIDDLTKSIDRLNRKLGGADADRFNKSLKETEKNSHAARSATQMLKHEYQQIDSALSAVIHKADQWNAKLAESRAGMRQEFKTLAVGSAAAGFGLYQFFQPAIEFEKQMSDVQAVLELDKHSKEMKQLQADARKWGAASSFSPTEAGQAQYNLGAGGFDFKQIHDALGGTLQLAEAGKVELGQAAQIAIGTLNGFGLAAKEINRINDVFLKSTNQTATSVQGLGETMKYVAPVAKQYGSSLEQSTAMAGILGNANILDTQAGTSLRAIMIRLAAPPKAARKALEEMGVATVDAKGNLRDMSDVLNDIRIATDGLGSAKKIDLLSKVSGVEAASAMAVLVDSTGEIDENTGKAVNKIKEYTQGLENAEGAAARAAQILKDNIAGDVETLGGSVQDLSISFGQILGGDLRKLVQQITEIIDRIKNWVDANPELVRTLAQIAIKLLMLKFAFLGIKYGTNLFLGAIISIIASITKMTVVLWILKKVAGQFGIGLPSRLGLISRLIQLLSRTFLIFGRVSLPIVLRGILAMSAALLSNPITWIIGLIAGLAFMIYKYWGPIKAFFKGFWDGLKIGLAPVFGTISTLFNEMKTILAPLKPLWDGLLQVWNWFKDLLGELFSPFQATNEQLANAAAYGSSVGQVIGGIIAVVGQLILIFVQLGVTILTVIVQAIASFINWVAMLPERVGQAMSAVKTWVMEAGAAFINFLLTPIRSIIDAVNVLISALNKIPMVNIPHIPQIPQLTASNAGTVPVKAAQTVPIAPLKIPQQQTVTNHFAAPVLSFSGLQNQQELSQIVEQQMNAWQKSISNSMSRSYSDND